MLKKWLEHPLTASLDIDDPKVTYLRQRVIRQNKFLMQIYNTWYDFIKKSIPEGAGQILELGSGAGFFNEVVPETITSEIFFLGDMKVILDGQHMPFANGSLKGIVMTNVLHHIPSAQQLFSEAARVVRPDGVVSMIEPWTSVWSKTVYTRLHHEPFDVESASWEFPSNGPLSGANAAMPWIIFQRDRAMFEREFPQWKVKNIKPIMPFAYLISGGVSMRPLMPGWSYKLIMWLETLLTPLMSYLAMFAHIVIIRQPDE